MCPPRDWRSPTPTPQACGLQALQAPSTPAAEMSLPTPESELGLGPGGEHEAGIGAGG